MSQVQIIIGLAASIIIILILILYKYYISKTWKDLMSFRESMDLTGLPIVTFMSNNKKYNFLLDTGSNYSIVNEKELKDIKYTESSKRSMVTGIDGKPKKASFVEVDLVYKNKDYKENFQVINMSAVFNRIKEESGVNVSGILGCAFFTKYEYTLDFKELIAYSKKLWKK